MDPATHRLFVGCRNPQKLVVIDANTGAVKASLPIGAGVDATRFHMSQAFASTGDGTLAVASEKGGKWIIDQTVTNTKRCAHHGTRPDHSADFPAWQSDGRSTSGSAAEL